MRANRANGKILRAVKNFNGPFITPISRDYSHRVLLPDDADLGSVTSRLSKEGLLIIEASRDPALLSKERNVDVSMELDEQEPEEQAKQVASGDTEKREPN